MLDLKFNKHLGKVIKSLDVSADTLFIEFDDNTGVKMTDQGQSCCEHRYMHSDDKLEYYVGAKLLNGRIEDAGGIGKYKQAREHIDYFIEYGKEGYFGDDVNECQFLIIDTDKGSFTIANYNEHNGYYGGFDLTFEDFNG